ncbi:hypothetical protein Lal_00024840 [Lupinus albus]|uniref:Uncharacterized protein n=1 Tax=Lupinus albus TaxID=3870 RepID=A0A6A4PWM6_LUPAL|nr:hypothetical protein Lalb_Chr10g0102541 [Lupinus albus]KAF1889513.1 hypothetical protein Lal_00024840 [Lupinus albus]
MANATFTQKYTCLALDTLGRCQASKVYHLGFNSKIKYNRFSTPDQNLGLRFQNDCTRKMSMVVYANIPSENPLPVDPNSPGQWKIWILGTIVTILLSFSKGKWGPYLLQLKDKIGTTIDEIEEIADIVEEVSEKVDKVAEEAEKKLPKGKLQDAAEFIEKVAEDINKHTQNAEDALQKVEGMEKELESLIESVPSEEKTTVVTTKVQDQK